MLHKKSTGLGKELLIINSLHLDFISLWVYIHNRQVRARAHRKLCTLYLKGRFIKIIKSDIINPVKKFDKCFAWQNIKLPLAVKFSLQSKNMPFGNGTGPLGQGPRTGRGAGYCSGYNVPGYANPVFGRGSDFGRGMGRGWRNWARVDGLPGWQKERMGYPARGGWGYYPTAYLPVHPPVKQEKEMIKEEMNALKEEMKILEDRLKELRDTKKSK